MARGNFLKTMGRKELVIPLLDSWFRAGQFPDEIPFSIHPNKPSDDAFHPSSDASLCARALYAKRMGHLEREPLRADNYKAFFAGHYWHALIQLILVEELGIVKPEDVEKECKIYRGTRVMAFPRAEDMTLEDAQPPICLWWARGHIDVAHCQIPGRGDYLVDIKTMGSHHYRLDRLPANVWDKYYAQMQCYLDWEDQQTCILLCIEKDSPHRFKEFLIERDPQFIESVYTRWDSVMLAIATETPPDCDMPHECPVADLYTAAL